jgi:hypothetical protein
MVLTSQHYRRPIIQNQIAKKLLLKLVQISFDIS